MANPAILQKESTQSPAQRQKRGAQVIELHPVLNSVAEGARALEDRLSPKQYAQYLIQKAELEAKLLAKASVQAGTPPIQHQQPRIQETHYFTLTF